MRNRLGWAGRAALAPMVVIAFGCSGSGASGAGSRPSSASSADSARADEISPAAQGGATAAGHAASGGAASARPAVLIVGTSLTAGYGLDDPTTQAYPALLQRKADSAGLGVEVVNAGLSGETSAGALRRIGWLLDRWAPRASVVVLETGANDGLRALDPDSTRANVDSIVRLVKARVPRARVLLVQMEAPPNLGTGYTQRFHALFPEVARREGIGLLPFLLENVAGKGSLNQADGIHPTAVGARIVANNLWPGISAALGR